jgi:membrane associated rhomboid family serine protease
LCPDDAGTGVRQKTRRVVAKSHAPITLWLVLINVAIWLLQILPGSVVTDYLAFNPLLTLSEPWRMLTSAFVHDPSNILHVGLNMYSVWIFGRILEPSLGRWRYLALYLISALGGSAAVVLISPLNTWVVGASTACFGLMAAYFVIARKLGANTGQLVGLVAINLVFGFIAPGIAWQGHLGGLVAGGVVAFLFTRNGSKLRQQQAAAALVAIGIALLAAAVAYVRIIYWG